VRGPGRTRIAALGIAAAVLLALPLATPLGGLPAEASRRLLSLVNWGPGEVVGRGSADEPWRIEIAVRDPSPPPTRLLAIDTDPDGYFESVPPPPADLAVVCARLQRAGVGVVGFGYPLQWRDDDLLALAALRAVLDRFDATVLGYPLKDSTSGEPVAAPFMLASAPYAGVIGDRAMLPVVNGIRGVAPELGGERTLAGFTRLETEAEEERRAYLLARWDDRVVFALPLAVEIARRGIDFDQVEIRMGEEIRLGREGPRIPIDFRGRIELPDEAPRRSHPAAAVIAETLPEDFVEGGRPLYFGDLRLMAPKAERRWAERVARVDAAIRRAPDVRVRRVLERLPLGLECALLGVGLLVLAAWMNAGRTRDRWRVLGIALVVVLALFGPVATALGHGPVLSAWVLVPPLAWLALLASARPLRVEVVQAGDDAPAPARRAPATKEAGKRRRKRRRKRR